MSNIDFKNIQLVDGFTKNSSTIISCAGHLAGLCDKPEIETACSEVADKLLKLGTTSAIDLASSTLAEGPRKWKEMRDFALSGFTNPLQGENEDHNDAINRSKKEFKSLLSGVKALLSLVVLFAGKRALKGYNIPGYITLGLQTHTVYESQNSQEALKNFAMLCLILKVTFQFNLVHYLYNKLKKGVEIASVRFEIKPANFLPEISLKRADKVINFMNVFWSLKFCAENGKKLVNFYRQ